MVKNAGKNIAFRITKVNFRGSVSLHGNDLPLVLLKVRLLVSVLADDAVNAEVIVLRVTRASEVHRQHPLLVRVIAGNFPQEVLENLKKGRKKREITLRDPHGN